MPESRSADSIALDFHKWGQVPYDAGFLLVRDGERHSDAFAAPAAYLRRETRGLAAGSEWPCDLGVDLSRGFRALKTWFTLKTYGTDKLGAIIARSCALASYLEARVRAEPRLELLAPVNLNIVCFRYRADDADRVNREIVVNLQESGIAAPSTTVLDGRLAIRCAIVNHRTDACDIDALVAAVLEFGARRAASLGHQVATEAWQYRVLRSGGAADGAFSGAQLLDLVEQLLLVGDELPGFLQRLIEVAAEDLVVDALDERPGARHGGDEIADQVEVGAVIGVGRPARCTSAAPPDRSAWPACRPSPGSGCPFRAGSGCCRHRSAGARADRCW